MGGLTPRRAIRAYCIDCVGKAALVRDCAGDKLVDGTCAFYPYRLAKGRPSVRTIRKNCLYCMNGQITLVKGCASKTCPTRVYRMGKNPSYAGRAKPLISPIPPHRRGFSTLETIKTD